MKNFPNSREYDNPAFELEPNINDILVMGERILNHPDPNTSIQVVNAHIHRYFAQDNEKHTSYLLTQPVSMPRLDCPEDMLDGEKVNNFAPNFAFYIAYRNKEAFIDSIPVPITKEQMLGTLNGTFEYKLVQFTNHSQRPAFWRMLALFPDFTSSLVESVSVARATKFQGLGDDTEVSRQALFVAWQLMSQLIDARDEFALNKDGTINDWYLKM